MEAIVRRFIWLDEDRFGSAGWVPMWIPKSAEFNATTGTRGIMHDMLEHRLCDTGKFHEELMAFGRIMALRHESGAFFYHDGHDQRAVRMGSELHSIWIDTQFERIEDAPRVTLDVGVWCKRFIHGIAKGFLKGDRWNSDDEDSTAPSERDLANVLNWLKLGYLDAYRRFGGEYGVADWAFVANDFAAGDKQLPRGDVEGEQLEVTLTKSNGWSSRQFAAYTGSQERMRESSRRWLYS